LGRHPLGAAVEGSSAGRSLGGLFGSSGSLFSGTLHYLMTNDDLDLKYLISKISNLISNYQITIDNLEGDFTK
jgi:hypothetical protein